MRSSDSDVRLPVRRSSKSLNAKQERERERVEVKTAPPCAHLRLAELQQNPHCVHCTACTKYQ